MRTKKVKTVEAPVESVTSVEIIEPQPPPGTRETVTITLEFYKRLLEDSRQYNHLLEMGVDNWEHYSILGDEEDEE